MQRRWPRRAGKVILEAMVHLSNGRAGQGVGLRGVARMSGARWGAGFTAAGRFVAEIEAAAAGKGCAEARLRAGRRRGFPARPLPRRRAQGLCAAGSAGFLPLRYGSGRDLDLRGAGPRADALADGALPGDFCAQCEAALYARGQEGRVCRAGALFSLAQSAGADHFCRRLHAHSLRHCGAWRWTTRTASSG